MKGLGIGLLVLIIAAVVVISQSIYIIPQDKQAIVLQLGQVQQIRNAATEVSVTTPDVAEEDEFETEEAEELRSVLDLTEDGAGLYFKLPFVQNVELLEKRNIGLDIPNIRVIAQDQEILLVDAFVRWRISNPLQFYQRLRTQGGAAAQLNRFTESAIREALGEVESAEIISGQRAQLMETIQRNVNEDMRENGVDIIDVRIRRADLPQDNSERVFERMRTARQQEAQRIRSEGEEQARRIRAEAAAEAQIIEANAQEQAEIIRGEGDAERARIYANAYERDPEFFSFYRSMLAYEKSIQQGTPIVLSPDSEFFRYFGDQLGQGDQ